MEAGARCPPGLLRGQQTQVPTLTSQWIVTQASHTHARTHTHTHQSSSNVQHMTHHVKYDLTYRHISVSFEINSSVSFLTMIS